MQIALDLRPLNYHTLTGVNIYILQVLQQLAQIKQTQKDLEIVGIGLTPYRQRQLEKDFPYLQLLCTEHLPADVYTKIPIPHSKLHNLTLSLLSHLLGWYNFKHLPKFDYLLLFQPRPLWKHPQTKQVCVFHDLYSTLEPQSTNPTNRFYTSHRLYKLIAKFSHQVWAVSLSTCWDLVRFLGVENSKIKLVYSSRPILSDLVQNSKCKMQNDKLETTSNSSLLRGMSPSGDRGLMAQTNNENVALADTIPPSPQQATLSAFGPPGNPERGGGEVELASSQHPPAPLKGGLNPLHSSENFELPKKSSFTTQNSPLSTSSFEGGGPQGRRMSEPQTNNEKVEFVNSSNPPAFQATPLDRGGETLNQTKNSELSENPSLFTVSSSLFNNQPLPKKYILALSGLEPRKNWHNLLLAHQKVSKQSDHHLVLAGRIVDKNYYKHLQRLIQQFQIPRVQWILSPNEDQKKFLLQHCLFVAYPSFYEGFGFPLLEAFEQGKCVLTSRISSMPEIGQEAALYINPLNVQDIARGLKLLLNDYELRHNLENQARNRVNDYSWEEVHQALIRLLYLER